MAKPQTQSGRACQQAGFVPLVVLVIIGALGAGSVATVAVSDNAKPGDILFPIDTAVEELRLAVTTNPEAEVELRTQFAAERVAEVEAALQERGVEAPGLDVALANLTSHKAAVASLVAQQQSKTQAKALDDLFEQKEQQLEAAFKEAKRDLKTQRASLKAQLAQATASGDTAKANSLRAQIAQIEAKLDALEAQEEQAEEALEQEEEKLEAQLEAEEKALEEKEEMLEEEQEKLEEQAGKAEEQKEKAKEAKKESAEED